MSLHLTKTVHTWWSTSRTFLNCSLSCSYLKQVSRSGAQCSIHQQFVPKSSLLDYRACARKVFQFSQHVTLSLAAELYPCALHMCPTAPPKVRLVLDDGLAQRSNESTTKLCTFECKVRLSDFFVPDLSRWGTRYNTKAVRKRTTYIAPGRVRGSCIIECGLLAPKQNLKLESNICNAHHFWTQILRNWKNYVDPPPWCCVPCLCPQCQNAKAAPCPLKRSNVHQGASVHTDTMIQRNCCGTPNKLIRYFKQSASVSLTPSGLNQQHRNNGDVQVDDVDDHWIISFI